MQHRASLYNYLSIDSACHVINHVSLRLVVKHIFFDIYNYYTCSTNKKIYSSDYVCAQYSLKQCKK
jgi:hypothetical protein